MTDIQRSAEAVWHGSLREGNGTLKTESSTLHDAKYSFLSRFEEDKSETNPEELLMAAHAGCYAMALANTLSRKEFNVHHIHTTATCTLGLIDGGRSITHIKLTVRGKVEDVEDDAFLTAAEETKRTCIISRALAGIEMELDAQLEKPVAAQ